MSSLLQIEVSPGGEHSVSRKISTEFINAWKAAHVGGTVIVKDFATTPVPHLDGSGADGLKGKKITFIISQGGSYAEGAPRHGWDYETGYLKLVANALGATDVEIILAEPTLAGVVPGMESLVEKKEASIAAAIDAAKKRAA